MPTTTDTTTGAETEQFARTLSLMIKTGHGADGFAQLLGAIEAVTAGLRKRIEQLEARPAAKGMSYRGVHEPGRTYAVGDIVTRQGSMWHCDIPTAGKPGESAQWTLCVKHGAAGKDGGK